MNAMTKKSCEDAEDRVKKNEVLIPAFGIHHKTIGNGNESNRISTTAFNIRCNPKYSSLLKNLMAR